MLTRGIIRECTNEANIIQPVSGANFVAIAGLVRDNVGTIINCSNTGAIESTTVTEEGNPATGGIAAINNGLIINCTNTGNISSKDAATGGIVGGNSGFIYKCINRGAVSVSSGNKGGICGEAQTYSYIIGCKNFAQVRAGICGFINNILGMFNDNGKFEVFRGKFIITDCENVVNRVPENPLHYGICGSFVIRNGEIRIARCKNIVCGEINNVSATNEYEYYGDYTETANLSRVVYENSSELGILEPTIGEAISIQLGEEKKISFSTDVQLAEIFIDNPLIGTLKDDGTYTSENVGEATAYYVYDDGSIVLHAIKVNGNFQFIENTPVPTNVVLTMDIPQSLATPIPTAYPTSAKRVKPKLQTITAKNITKTYGNKAFELGAKTNGNGKLTYTSSNKKVVTVSGSGKVTIKGYGKATITINAAKTAEYKATIKKVTITIKPKKAVLSSAKSTKAKTITVKWKKDTKATGYILQYSTDKKFKKNVKKITIANNKTTSKKISRLKAGKKYYVRVCSYKKSSGKKIQGSYSAVKSVKVKK